jgi:hypothetical protein
MARTIAFILIFQPMKRLDASIMKKLISLTSTLFMTLSVHCQLIKLPVLEFQTGIILSGTVAPFDTAFPASNIFFRTPIDGIEKTSYIIIDSSGRKIFFHCPSAIVDSGEIKSIEKSVLFFRNTDISYVLTIRLKRRPRNVSFYIYKKLEGSSLIEYGLLYNGRQSLLFTFSRK